MKKATSLLGVVALVGCAPTATTDDKPKYSFTSTQMVRAAIGGCMIPPVTQSTGKMSKMTISGDLISPVVGLVIDKGVNMLGTALEEAGKEKISYTMVSANVASSADLKGACIQIVKGSFVSRPPAGDYGDPARPESIGVNSRPEWARALGLQAGRYQQLVNNGIEPAMQPQFIFEGYLRPSADANTYAIAPTLVAFFHPSEQRFLRFGKDRDILLHFAFHGTDKKPDASDNPSTEIHVGAMQAPSSVFWSQPNNGRATPGESPWVKVPNAPFTATVTVFETEAANEAMLFVASIFKKQGADIAEKIKELTLKSAQEEARKKQLTEEATAVAAFNTALGDAIKKLEQCAKSESAGGKGGSVDSATAAAAAVDQANILSIAARKPAPFYTSFKPSSTPGTNQTICKQLFDWVS